MTFRPRAVATVVAALIGVAVAAQTPPATPRPDQQQPVFRAEIDLIQLDVSVLDRNRRPIKGLTAADFTVLEDGKPQRIVAVSEVNVYDSDIPLTSWMKHVPRDVSHNDLVDALGDGRLVAIVLDDVNMPFDADDIIANARDVAREVIDLLGPSDLAAVIYPRDAGKSEDFTADRDKLLAAVDKFVPHPITWMQPTLPGVGPGGGDMPYRTSSVLSMSTCERMQPTIPALDTVTSRMASVPKRRKTIFFVSPGVPLRFGSRDECQFLLGEQMKDVFRKAQRANVNIYGVDPAGAGGYENYLMERNVKLGGMNAVGAQTSAMNTRRLLHDFLEITAEETGARALTTSTQLGPDIEQAFDEASDYYLVGYQTSNIKTDGKFRRIEVKVNRPDVTVRARTGYWGARDAKVKGADQGETAPTTLSLAYAGMSNGPGLPLRLVATPLGPSPSAASDGRAPVAVVLTVRLPSPRAPADETLTIVTNVYDADGKPGPPSQQTASRQLIPSTTDELRYDVLMRVDLPPGRHELRVNARSRFIDKSGTVFGPIEVPDFARAPLSLSGIVFGTSSGDVPRTDPLAALVPLVPTSVREYAPADKVSAFLRVFQGGGSGRPLEPVAVGVQVFDAFDKTIVDRTETISPASFDDARGAPFTVELPIAGLQRGPHLLSIQASAPGVPPVRRDAVFRVR
jgi:VWFA-related protein